MPELPDITVYCEALEKRLLGTPLRAVKLKSPFLLRTVDPPVSEAVGRKVVAIKRIGKRIVLGFENDVFAVIHLMIAGRFQWKKKPAGPWLAAFEFDLGSLLLTEASKKQRASLHMTRGAASLEDFDRGGVEPLTCTRDEFAQALTCESHTIKRTLTDPTLISGVGNAYSDEILHRARMSPLLLTKKMSEEQIDRLFTATRAVLVEWIDRLRKEVGEGWPTKVTAFRDEMAVHGKFGKPCPDCGAVVQRISYADNETNYCAHCQTEGKLLADRSLSQLMRGDWPKTLAELEERKKRLTNG